MTIDVIRLAREAGIAPKPMTIDGVEYEYQHVEFNDNIGGDEFGCIERFAALVVEECAKVCDALKDDETQFNAAVEKQLKGNDEARQLHALRMLSNVQLYNAGFIKSAAAIRARKPA